MLDSSRAYAGFAVPDPEAARAFYAETLGLDVTSMMDGTLLDLRLGSNHVLVYHKPDHEPATFTVLNFPVDDVDAAVDRLVAAGVEMARFDGFDQDERGISRGGEGPTIAWFRDPAGNILAVHSLEEM